MIWEILKFHQKGTKKAPKKTIFGFFNLSEGYEYHRIPRVNSFLQSFGKVKQLYTTGSSGDMVNQAILSL